MKQYLSGAGADTSVAVRAYLKANKRIWVADLILIGEPDDPKAIWITNYESPLQWSLWGTFNSTVMKRGSVRSAIGLEAESLDITWSPRNRTATGNIQNTSPYELARVGFFDNMRFRMWRTIMPTPGDADTFGAAEWFAGWIGDAQTQDGAIQFSINSYMYALNQKVPSGVIEVTNPVASYSGAVPPAGFTSMPKMQVINDHTPGTTNSVVYAVGYPDPFYIPANGIFDDHYLVFIDGSSLQGQFSVIGRNTTYHGGTGYDRAEFQLYSPLPWAPAAGDLFYIAKQAPINSTDGSYYGFPYVPAPETAA
jgi:hypothetical protein